MRGLLLKNSFKGVTLIELIIVVVIMAILAAIAVPLLIPRNVAERHARVMLKIIWQAEKDYFAYRTRYSNSWKELNMDDPNKSDSIYTYDFEESGRNLVIKATRKGSNSGLRIDKDGNITVF